MTSLTAPFIAHIGAVRNGTKENIRITYWKQILPGLTENVSILILSCSETKIPTDNCVDEFIVMKEDYSRDLFKFRQSPAADGSRFWTFTDKFTVNISVNSKKNLNVIEIKLSS